MHSSPQIEIGFQERTDTYSNKLGFLIPFNPSVKNENFNRWINKKIPNKILNNVPTTGFIFNKNISRQFHYSTSQKMRIFHPEGFEFEISMSNVSFILSHANISAQEIMCPCIIGWHSNQVFLLPAHSPEAIKLIKENSNFTQLKICDIYQIKSNDFVYLGETQLPKFFNDFSIYSIQKSISSPQKPTSEHFFYDLKNNCFSSYNKLPNIEFTGETIDSNKLDDINNSLKEIFSFNKCKVQKISPENFIANEYFNNKDISTLTQQEKITHFYESFENATKFFISYEDLLKISLIQSKTELGTSMPNPNHYNSKPFIKTVNTKDLSLFLENCDKDTLTQFIKLNLLIPTNYLSFSINNSQKTLRLSPSKYKIWKIKNIIDILKNKKSIIDIN